MKISDSNEVESVSQFRDQFFSSSSEIISTKCSLLRNAACQIMFCRSLLDFNVLKMWPYFCDLLNYRCVGPISSGFIGIFYFWVANKQRSIYHMIGWNPEFFSHGFASFHSIRNKSIKASSQSQGICINGGIGSPNICICTCHAIFDYWCMK